MTTLAALTQPSFRAKQADFFFPFRSCETVGLRSEKSLQGFAVVGAAFRGGPGLLLGNSQ
jgi:hypothetical protein